jgi:AmmeMemoRadiSam system protein A
MLCSEEKRALLDLARKTLESYLTDKTTPQCRLFDGALTEKKGAFVSLHNGEDLRGCIGQLSPDAELYEVVQHCVISAALEDTRFMPVTKAELAELNIEISVLTPFRRIQQIEDIEVGKHGLYIAQGYYRGLLLPQVAVQYGWDRITFLRQTCRKSGLPESAWQDPRTAVHTFEAEVFSE